MMDDLKYLWCKLTGGQPYIDAPAGMTRRTYDALEKVRAFTGKKLEAYRIEVRLVPAAAMRHSKSLGYPVPVVEMNDGEEVCGYVLGRRRAPRVTLATDAAGNVPEPVLLHECAEAIAKSNGMPNAHRPPFRGRVWGC